MTGIDRKAAGNDAEACLELNAIYIALLTLESDRTFPSREGVGVGLREASEQRQARRVSALEQLNAHARLVLLGDPGGGKSTFVNFVAMCLAGELLAGETCANLALLTAPLPKDDDDDDKKEPPRQTWEQGALLPVVIVLRDFAANLPTDGKKATASDLWEFVAQTLHATACRAYAPYLHRHLLEQGGLILLDGLDEVPEAEQRRAQIKQAVEDFAASFPKCRIVVTSRTYAYQQQEWRLTGFVEATLARFTNGQIRQFIDHWYQYYAERRNIAAPNAQGRAELLKQAVFARPQLTDFAQRPLLLTLMASLHAWRGGSLPEKREDLYNDTVELLLDSWERPKVVTAADGTVIIRHESLSELLKVTPKVVRAALELLAYQAHGSQLDVQATADIAEKDLVGALMDLSQNRDLQPRRLIEYLRDRAGLLVPRGVKVYAFPHRTFQEYLAACYLTNQDDYPDNVAELVGRDPNRWREAVLLAAAKASRGAASTIWTLAEALCTASVPLAPGSASETLAVQQQDAWGALLAGQALVEVANLDQISPRNQTKLNRIRDWLAAILTEHVTLSDVEGQPFPAVERALSGNLLAKLGDPREGVGLRDDGLPDIVWRNVPEGKFRMGSDEYSSERPIHEVHVPAFEISRYPVTNAQYQAFIEDGGYTEQWRACWTKEGWAWRAENKITEPRWVGGVFDLPNHPVVRVSWYEAIAFCAWLTEKTRLSPGDQSPGSKLKQAEARSQDFQDASASFSFEPGALAPGVGAWLIRLPTEAEWEKAARGADGRRYPWGNAEATPEHANYGETGLGVTSAVGCFSRGTSPYGCDDMAGNVWEWCLDVWHDSYQNAPKDGSAWEEGKDVNLRLLRGGAWNYVSVLMRCADRYSDRRDIWGDDIGFRLARSALRSNPF